MTSTTWRCPTLRRSWTAPTVSGHKYIAKKIVKAIQNG